MIAMTMRMVMLLVLRMMVMVIVVTKSGDAILDDINLSLLGMKLPVHDNCKKLSNPTPSLLSYIFVEIL
jgi:hypothetical protein